MLQCVVGLYSELYGPHGHFSFQTLSVCQQNSGVKTPQGKVKYCTEKKKDFFFFFPPLKDA